MHFALGGGGEDVCTRRTPVAARATGWLVPDPFSAWNWRHGRRLQGARYTAKAVCGYLPAGQVSDPERRRRFIQEARATSALNHANIITIHDIGREGGIDFVVMEYVAGKTLGQLIPKIINRCLRKDRERRYQYMTWPISRWPFRN
jgi:hypothetical protein